MSDAQTNRLFVYGTLAPGQCNHSVLADIPGTWVPASLCGVLYEEGWGAEMGCPGIVPDPAGNAVAGFLLSADTLEAHWARLDEFEGAGYRRVCVDVQTEGGSSVTAHVYALNRE